MAQSTGSKKKLRNNNYLLENLGGSKDRFNIHIDRIKPAVLPNESRIRMNHGLPPVWSLEEIKLNNTER